LWLAETSQQPISQTTWLKVTPHCNHCISQSMYKNCLFSILEAGKLLPTFIISPHLPDQRSWPVIEQHLIFNIFYSNYIRPSKYWVFNWIKLKERKGKQCR
jgi:hypothetical protein